MALNLDRIKHWLSVGAKPSERIHLFLAEVGLLPKKAFTVQTKKNQSKRKAQERLQAEIANKAAAEQAAQTQEESASVEEIEETPTETIETTEVEETSQPFTEETGSE